MNRFRAWLKTKGRLIISLIGVGCIPLIYAGALISANQDPIGRLHDVPALVVNEDQPFKASTGDTLELGGKIVEELKSSHDPSNLDWKEASADDAAAQLRDGRAMAVMTIPSDFSESVASAGAKDPADAVATSIQVSTNDSSNYLMGTIAKSIGGVITDSVRKQVSEEYLKNVYVGFTNIHEQIGTAADGAGQLADGTGTAKKGAGDLVVGLGQLVDGSVKLNSGAGQLAQGAGALNTGAGKLSDGLNELKSKTSGLPDQAAQLDDGAKALAKGTKTLDSSVGKLDDGAKQLATGTKTLDSSVGKLDDGAKQLATGTKTLDDGVTKLDGGAQQVAAGAGELNDKAQVISTDVKKVATGAKTALTGLGGLLDSTALLDSSTKVDLVKGTSNVNADLEALQNDKRLNEALDQLTPAQADAVRTKLAAVTADSAKVAQGTKQTQAAIDEAKKQAGIVQGSQGTSVDDLIAATDKVSGAATQFSDGTKALSNGASQVAGGAKQLKENTPKLAAGAAQLADGTGQLKSATPKLADGAGKLADGTGQLKAATPKLADGAGKLADGTGQLRAAVPTLTGAIGQAAAGAGALHDGAGKLSDGATTLATGTGSLVDGTKKADEGGGKLSDGLGKLDKGATDLSTGLDKGVKEIPSYTGNEKDHLADVNAAPVALDSQAENKMANYGTGLTPYFMSLALWIGGIAFFMLMAPLPQRLVESKLPAPLLALRAYLPSAIMALVQATVITVVVLFVLRIDVAHPMTLWLLAMLGSLAFLAVNQGLVALLGAPGRFLSLILVVLQIASAGGTYPWQTMPDFFQAIHPYLPMTYTVEAFRSLVGGGPGIGVGAAASILGVWMIGGLLALLLASFLVRRSDAIRDWATLAPGLPNGGRRLTTADAGTQADAAAKDDATPATQRQPALVGAGAAVGAAGAGVGASTLGTGAAEDGDESENGSLDELMASPDERAHPAHRAPSAASAASAAEVDDAAVAGEQSDRDGSNGEDATEAPEPEEDAAEAPEPGDEPEEQPSSASEAKEPGDDPERPGTSS